jgi:hypothetical protein
LSAGLGFKPEIAHWRRAQVIKPSDSACAHDRPWVQ